MADDLPKVYLARHGETQWSASGQHTGLTDLPLTGRGQSNALQLGERLRGMKFDRVWTSPLQRASQTCQLAGFGNAARTVPELVEWNYGEYEGLRSAEILANRPGWQLFRDGCPGGESPEQVAHRADGVVRQLRTQPGITLVFSSGHFLRMLATRWLDFAPLAARQLLLSTASLSILGYNHGIDEPAIQLWNDTSHVRG